MTRESGPGSLDVDRLRESLQGRGFGKRLEYHPIVDSTSSLGKVLAGKGAAEGTVILTEEQTGGRGRGDHTWLSTRSLGLYLSLILRPEKRLLTTPVFGLLGGVASVRAVQEVSGLAAALKWPNDVLIRDRKAGGILAEADSGRGGDHPTVVLGIGLNVYHSVAELPTNTPIPATSLVLEGWEVPDRIALILHILEHSERLYGDLCARGVGPLEREIMEIWAERGRRVTLEGGNAPEIQGRAVALHLAEGHLVLEVDKGQEVTVSLNRFLRLKRLPEKTKPEEPGLL